MRTCKKCGQETDDFYIGHECWCKSCTKKEAMDGYTRRKGGDNDPADVMKKYGDKNAAACWAYKEMVGCSNCGERRHWVLDFHHLKGGNKGRHVSARKWFEQGTQNEVKKCVVLCANCHRDVHYRSTF